MASSFPLLVVIRVCIDYMESSVGDKCLLSYTYTYQKVRIRPTEVFNLNRRWQRMLSLKALVQIWSETFLCTERLEDKNTHANDALP